MLRGFFKATSEKLFSDFNASKSIKHNLTKGEAREEYILQEFLKPNLPKKYSVSPGIIIDCDDVQSKQQDLVIYDDFNSPILQDMGKNKLFFPEIVRIVIEVKSSLNGKEIDDVFKKSLSIVNLKKSYFNSSIINNYLPDSDFSLRPFFICMCYESEISLESTATKIRELSNKNNCENPIDLLCILQGLKKETGLIANVDPMNIHNILSLPKRGSKLVVVPYKVPEDSLLFAYLIILNNLLIKEMSFLYPDIIKYAYASGFPHPQVLITKEEQKGAYLVNSEGKRLAISVREISDLSIKVIKNKATDNEIIDWFYYSPQIPGGNTMVDINSNFYLDKEIAFLPKPMVVYEVIQKIKSKDVLSEEEKQLINKFVEFVKNTMKEKKILKIGTFSGSNLGKK